MMNLIALSLILTSFAVSGLFSPNPVTNNNGDQVIVKDGHRAVVVEYADDFSADGNTKVLISPPHHHHSKVSEGEGPEGEALSRVAASVAGVAKDAVHGGGPRELICDAYGKCKHKVAGVLGRAKEKAAEAEEKARDKTGDLVHETKEKVRETGEMARDKTGDLIHDAKEKVRETGGKLRDKTEGMVYDTKEKVKETGEKIRDKTEDIVHETKEKVKETGEKIREKTEETKEKGKKEITEIGMRGKEVVIDVIRYFLQGVEAVGSMMNLMGFGIAYGMGVWVTFAMSYVLARVLGRQQFGVVQSKVYPVYFKGMVAGIGLALLGHLLGHGGRVFRTKGGVLQVYNLMGSLVSVLGNLLFLEPRATKVMFERMKLEKEEGRGIDSRGAPVRVIDAVVTEPAGGAAPTTTTTTTTAAAHTTVALTQPVRPEQDAVKSKLGELDERLKKLNSYSSLLNIMTLIGLTWHLVYLSQRLNVTT